MQQHHELQSLKAQREQDRMTIEALKGQLEAITEEMNETTHEYIAFTVVSHKNFGPSNLETYVPFEVVEINVGDGWNPDFNVFEAPVSGVYLFAASSLGDLNHDPWLAITHTSAGNTRRVVSLRSAIEADTGFTGVCIIRMDAGDYTALTLLPDTYDTNILMSNSSHIYSTFSGFYLFP